MKRIVTMQDLSCVGRCSLSVALPLLSAAGIEAVPLPTAVLSAHTAFRSVHIRNLSNDIPHIYRQWENERLSFDAVSTGYLGTRENITHAMELIRLAKRSAPGGRAPHGKHPLIIVDPAMGDGGSLYAGISASFPQDCLSLCAEADYILPNLTEVCLLLGAPYRDNFSAEEIRHLVRKLSDRLKAVLRDSDEPELPSAKGHSPVIVMTSVATVQLDPETAEDSGNTASGPADSPTHAAGALLYDPETDTFSEAVARKYPGAFHGTGDIFAAVFAGSLMNDMTAWEAASLAADYVSETIRTTLEDPEHVWYGVEFEKTIPYLTYRLRMARFKKTGV